MNEIAQKVGTPFYLYSYNTLVRHFTVFNQAFDRIPHLVCYSAKANSNIALIRLFVSLGGGWMSFQEENSIGPSRQEPIPKKIVFSGVGKREDEIEYALNVRNPDVQRGVFSGTSGDQ